MDMRRRLRKKQEGGDGGRCWTNKKKEPKVLHPGHLTGDWKQPRCPSADEGVKKRWYICTAEYHTDIKRNKTGSCVQTWMNLESVIQSSVKSKRERQISY